MMLSSSILLVFIVGQVISQTCTSDANCGYGVCVDSGCSCYSGFGGANGFCGTKPSSSCVSFYSTPNASVNTFEPTSTFDVAGNNFLLTIAANLDQTPYVNPSASTLVHVGNSTTFSTSTLIIFNGDVNSPCNYPYALNTSLWSKTAAVTGTCSDNFDLDIPWRVAQANCFTYDAVWGGYRADVTVLRTYMVPLPDLDTLDRRDVVTIVRNESVTLGLAVFFPTSVEVSTELDVSGPIAVSVSAVSLIQYDANDGRWEIQISTITKAPYQLNLLGVDFGDDSRITFSDFVNSSSCDTNFDNCAQTLTVYLSNCDAVSGTLAVTLFPQCSGGVSNLNCAPVAGNVTINAQLDTQDSCALNKTINVQVQTLQSYKDATLTTTKTSFKASQSAYFAATIQSTDATIFNRTLESVCLQLDAEGECLNVTFSLLSSPSETQDPAFSVNLAQTRGLTNSTSASTFLVRATVGLVWLDGSVKRQVSYGSGSFGTEARITLSDDAEDSDPQVDDPIPEQVVKVSSSSSSSFGVGVIASFAAVVGVVVIAVVGAIIYLKKRTNPTAYSIVSAETQ